MSESSWWGQIFFPHASVTVTSHHSELSIMMFTVEHTTDSVASGEKGRWGCCYGDLPPTPLSPHLPHFILPPG